MYSNNLLRLWGPAILLFVILALVMFLMRRLVPDPEIFTGWVEAWLPHGVAGWLIYVFGAACLMCIAGPRQLISFAGGYAFGAVVGTILATLGVTLGCALAFSLARWGGQRFVERRYGERLRRFNTFLARNPFWLAVLLRLFPSGNNLLFSVAAGVSRIPALPFFLGSCLGYIPQNLIFSLLGSGARVDPVWRFGVGGALFVVSGFLAWLLYQRFRFPLS